MAASVSSAIPEQDFAARVDGIVREATVEARVDSAAIAARAKLLELLREDHAVYSERSAAAIVRMRGWVLLALEKLGVRDRDLSFVLEEIDNGRDPYLVAAAARALRTYPSPALDFVPLLEEAIENIRYHDDSLDMNQYGGYGMLGAETTTAAFELERTLTWLKKKARPGDAAAAREASAPSGRHACCSASHAASLEPSASSDAAVFEDHDGRRVAFKDFFRQKPAIVAFFYTRCGNPLKCSLTVAKLAHVQQVMRERGLFDRIRIAAITYDPAYDVPERMRGYAQNRAMVLNDDHRMLRGTEHWDAVRQSFELGVNFVGSIVNRHRIEVFVLDDRGRIAVSFERLRWNEAEIVARAEALLMENSDRQDSQGAPLPASSADRQAKRH